MKNALKLGLILGIIGIVMSLVVRYTMDSSVLFSTKQILFSFAVTIIVLIVGGRKLLRNEEEGKLGYGEALKGVFIASMFATLISMPAAIILFGNDDEVMMAHQRLKKSSEEAGLELGMKMAGLSEAEREAEKEKFYADKEDEESIGTAYPYSWTMFPSSIATSGITYFFLSLLIALAVKEKGA